MIRIYAVADENKKFFLSVQDGSHPYSPMNTPLKIMTELQNDLQDISDGFEARFAQIARQGYQSLGGDSNTEPEVSILPIPTQGLTVDDRVSGDLSDALLQRDAREIAAALDRASQFDDQSTFTAPSPTADHGSRPATTPLGTALGESPPLAAELNPEVSTLHIPNKDGGNHFHDAKAALGHLESEVESTIESRESTEEELSSLSGSSTAKSEPEFSVLPVPGNEGELADAQLGLLGRGKGEIEAAFERASGESTSGVTREPEDL